MQKDYYTLGCGERLYADELLIAHRLDEYRNASQYPKDSDRWLDPEVYGYVHGNWVEYQDR